MQYFIKRGEKVQGPFSREQLVKFAKAQKITGSDRVGSSANGPFQELKAVWASINEPADQQMQSDNMVSNTQIGPQALPATDYYSQQIKEGGKKPVKKKKKQNTWDAMAGWIEKNKIIFNRSLNNNTPINKNPSPL